MGENVPPGSASKATATKEIPGLPYYEKLRRDLRDTLAKKRLIDRNLVIVVSLSGDMSLLTQSRHTSRNRSSSRRRPTSKIPPPQVISSRASTTILKPPQSPHLPVQVGAPSLGAPRVVDRLRVGGKQPSTMRIVFSPRARSAI